jgi:hypothetical protein
VPFASARHASGRFGPPRAELVALCRLEERSYWPLRRWVPAHAAPDEGCRCGIYAAATAAQAAASVTDPARPRDDIVHHVIGRVSLWGTVVECEHGWRAERVYLASLVVPAPMPQAPKRHILRRRRQRSRSRPAAEIARALREYGVPVELVACETLGELVAALEARAGGAAVSGRTLILSAGERAALLAALRRRHRFPHGPATAATAVVALGRAEPVRGGYRVLVPTRSRATRRVAPARGADAVADRRAHRFPKVEPAPRLRPGSPRRFGGRVEAARPRPRAG